MATLNVKTFVEPDEVIDLKRTEHITPRLDVALDDGSMLSLFIHADHVEVRVPSLRHSLVLRPYNGGVLVAAERDE